jgi:hypothetical protein
MPSNVPEAIKCGSSDRGSENLDEAEITKTLPSLSSVITIPIKTV